MATGTGAPVGSKSPVDLLANAENLDHAVNTDAPTWTDRFGNPRPALKRLETDYPLAGVYSEQADLARIAAEQARSEAQGQAVEATTQAQLATQAKTQAEKARDASMQSANTFKTIEEGRAAVADGMTFDVEGAGNVAAFRYRRLTSATHEGPIARLTDESAVAQVSARIAPILASVSPRLSFADADGFSVAEVTSDGGFASDSLALVPASSFGLKAELSMMDAEGFHWPVTSTPVRLPSIRESLSSELDDVRLRLVGDSITWGMTVTGGGPLDPRNHQLTDTRNNLTSPSWANLLHRYLGARYSSGVMTNPAPGVALYQATHHVDLAQSPRIGVVASNQAAAAKISVADTSSALGVAVDVASGHSLTFDMVGDNFTVIYAKRSADPSAAFEVLVDGISQGSVSAYAASTVYAQEAAYSVTPGPHSVELRCTGTVRFETVRRLRTIRVANDGLIGTNTTQWLPDGVRLPDSVANDDTHVFVQLGTNDRALTSAPNDPARTKRNLSAIAQYVSATRGKRVTLMAANYADGDYPGGTSFKYSQADVARAVAQVAAEGGYDYIDNYAATLEQQLAGITFLADGLHPNDAGHMQMFKNITRSLELA